MLFLFFDFLWLSASSCWFRWCLLSLLFFLLLIWFRFTLTRGLFNWWFFLLFLFHFSLFHDFPCSYVSSLWFRIFFLLILFLCILLDLYQIFLNLLIVFYVNWFLCFYLLCWLDWFFCINLNYLLRFILIIAKEDLKYLKILEFTHHMLFGSNKFFEIVIMFLISASIHINPIVSGMGKRVLADDEIGRVGVSESH